MTIGFIMITRLSYNKAVKQCVIAAGGVAISLAVPVIIRKVKQLSEWRWLYCGVGIVALAAVVVVGTEQFGAKLGFMVGGVGVQPCQDYSSAGHRNEDLGRAQLTIKFAEIITRIRPSFFLMENVPNIQKSEKLDQVLNMFHESGYGISKMVIDASRCGVPQKRRRFIVLGGLNEPEGFLDELLYRGQSKKNMTLRDYFGNSLGFEYYFRVPRSYSRRGIFSIDEPAMTVRGVDRPVPSGYLGHPNDPIPLNPSIRTLTPQERSWIQTFPKDFNWGEASKTNLNLAIGNAVPVKLAEYIANCIKEYIYGKKNN